MAAYRSFAIVNLISLSTQSSIVDGLQYDCMWSITILECHITLKPNPFSLIKGRI
jgi:hypothetical protein